MHVLMTADTVGGVWTYTRELVSGLIRRGHRITLVSFGKLPCTSQIAWMQELQALDYRPTPYALEWMQDSEKDIELSTKYLDEVIAEVRPDLLHFNQYAYGAIDTDLPKVVVAHSDVVSWWVAVKGEHPPTSEWMDWYCGIVNRGLAGAVSVVAPSQWMLEQVRGYHLQKTTGIVINNGRNPSLFDPNTKKTNQVVSVGRLWDEAKQISLLSEHEQAVPVLIAGLQDHPGKLPMSEKENPRIGRATFCGVQSEKEISALFARSSLYAACSRYEPFGLAPVEAALSRCALIANDIPTFRELWGDTACYFRANDAQSLADAIRGLSENTELRNEYGRRAYERARGQFTAERMLDDYEQLYGSLVPQELAA